MHTFTCEMDLALTYSMRRRELARQCCVRAFIAAIHLGRPDLIYQANSLLGVLS